MRKYSPQIYTKFGIDPSGVKPMYLKIQKQMVILNIHKIVRKMTCQIRKSTNSRITDKTKKMTMKIMSIMNRSLS